MITGSIEKAARTRWAMPVAVSLVLLAMAVNEWTYQHTRRTLDHGIALTDARIEAARTRQILTEMEAAANALLASGSTADRQRFDAAGRELPLVEGMAFALIAKVDPQGLVPIDGVRALTKAHALRLRSMVEASPATSVGALRRAAIDDGRSGFVDLSQAFDDVLAQAAGIQQKARVSLYDAFQINRLTDHVLLLLTLLTFWLFSRQLRLADAQKSQERQRLEHEIARRTAELRDLAGHLVDAREDERARLARELHDEMGGLLTAMKLELARLRRVAELPRNALDRVAGLEGRINDGIALKRRIIENLRPSSLDQLGLKAALEMLCADAAAMLGIPVHTEIDELSLQDKDGELTLYRVVQESLTNIAKYASARAVWVRLQRTADGLDGVTLSVRDDGRGFDPRAVGAGHHGLLGMRLRLEAQAGSLWIDSEPGRGTQLLAALPSAAVSDQSM